MARPDRAIREPRPPKADKTLQWSVLSGERRAHKRAAGAGSCVLLLEPGRKLTPEETPCT
jgi:hypothetical protein